MNRGEIRSPKQLLLLTYFIAMSAFAVDDPCPKLLGGTDLAQSHGPKKYIHAAGDIEVERQRLKDQAEMLRQDIWRNIHLQSHALAARLPFLEVGCGVGAQTPDLLAALPLGSRVVGIDFDPAQVAKARSNLESLPHLSGRYSLATMDAQKLAFPDRSFSGAYVSWVLEHMPKPEALKILSELKRTVAPGGLIVINEVHLSTAHSWQIQLPGIQDTIAPNSRRFIDAMIREQIESQGDPNVGSAENIIPLLKSAGFNKIHYGRLVMHYDQNNLDSLKSYADYLVSLWKSVLPDLIKSGKFTEAEFETVKAELDQATVLRQEAGQIIVEND